MIAIERRQTSSSSSSSLSHTASTSISASSSSPSITTHSMTPTSSPSSSIPPLFQVPTASPTPTPMPQHDNSQGQTKTILEWLFLAVALLLLAAIVIRRANNLRNNGIPLSRFFARKSPYRRRRSQGLLSDPTQPETTQIRRLPRTTGLPTLSPSSASAPYHLAEIPVAHLPGDDRQGSTDRYIHHINHLLYGQGRRARTRGVDIGEGGRRGVGERDVERDYFGDHQLEDDGDGGLPAYDKHGGPPLYVEVLGVRAANTGSSRERPTTEGTRETLPPSASSASQSGPDENRNTTQSTSRAATSSENAPPAENPFVGRGTEIIRPPTRSHPPRYSPSFSMMPGSLSNW